MPDKCVYTPLCSYIPIHLLKYMLYCTPVNVDHKHIACLNTVLNTVDPQLQYNILFGHDSKGLGTSERVESQLF